MGARGSTTLAMIMINVVVLVATTAIGVVATELFTHLPTVGVLGRCAGPRKGSHLAPLINSRWGRRVPPSS